MTAFATETETALSQDWQSKPVMKALSAVAILLFAAVVVQNAWVCDDAYITFRTVDNFIHGYGLRWNVAERVQSYTHPLWMFLMSATALASKNIYYGSIIASTLVSLASVLIYCFGIARSSAAAILGALVLSFAKGFVDYSTSGLENPLTHLLLALFLWIYLWKPIGLKQFFFLSLLGCLGTLNRMDTLLLYLPALIYAGWKLPRRKALSLLCLGFAPFVLWEAFSVLYYGFPFPNTAYAKLKTGVDSWQLMRQGFRYLADAGRQDPLTLVPMIGAIALAWTRRDVRTLVAAMGMVAYVVYVIRIGGDFMSSRLLTPPLFVATGIIGALVTFDEWRPWLACLGAVLVVGLAGPNPPICTTASYGSTNLDPVPMGVVDERAYYFQTCGLLNAARYDQMPAFPSVKVGVRSRLLKRPVGIIGMAGFYGYYCGPEVRLVDEMALCDPLLARLPCIEKDGGWRVGHYVRQIPLGYLQAWKEGKNLIQNQDLANYYDQLSKIIRGPLLGRDRLMTIWKMNTGQFDSLLQSYKDEPMMRVTLDELQRPGGYAYNNLLRIGHAGLRIDLPANTRATHFKIALSCGDEYRAIFYSGDMSRGSVPLLFEQRLPEGNVIVSDIYPVPAAAANDGFDNVRIVPVVGEDNQFGAIRFANDPHALTGSNALPG